MLYLWAASRRRANGLDAGAAAAEDGGAVQLLDVVGAGVRSDMGGEMSELWDRFWLWLFRDLMPPPDPLLAHRVTLQEVCRQFGEVLAPTMAEVAVIFRQFAEAAESWEER